jgi:hypothetical protein
MKFPFRGKNQEHAAAVQAPEKTSARQNTEDNRPQHTDRWEIQDIIDLEYFLQADEYQDEEDLLRRDRGIFLQITSQKRKRPPSRRFLIRQWLENRKKEEQDPTLPGAAFHETLVLAKWLVLISGLLAGGGAAFSLLQYQGVQPVNVSSYIALLIFFQALLLILLAAGFLLRRFSPFFRRRTFVAGFWGTLLFNFARRMATGAAKRLDSERKNRLQATLGLLKSRRSVYGNIFFLPVFLLAQFFGLAFNMGALATTLVRVLTSDLAFGWQSTLQASPETVHRIVRILALPWSWLVPEGSGYPTLTQIENSRIILKEGIAHLATTDLVSWWPFLCLGLVCYGIVPRFFLCLATWIVRRIKLARLDFSHAACDALVRRMQTPLLETALPDRPAEKQENNGFDPFDTGSELAPQETIPAVALLKEELADRISQADITQIGKVHFAMKVMETLQIGGLLDQEQKIIDGLKERRWENEQAGVLLVMEAWQPPILETLDFLRQLRMALPEKGKIGVFLVGRPKAATIFTVPGKIDRRVWEEQLQALGDPYLGIAAPRKGVPPHE